MMLFPLTKIDQNMAPFDRIQDAEGRVLVDWHLMQNGAVTLFDDRPNFDYAASWLAQHDYTVHPIDICDKPSFVVQMNDALCFPQLFGYEWNGNLDALNDRILSITFDETAGVVFAFSDYDRLASADYRVAHATLDIIAWASRFHLLFGNRLLALVHTNDRKLEFEALGAQNALRNHIRWVQSQPD